MCECSTQKEPAYISQKPLQTAFRDLINLFGYCVCSFPTKLGADYTALTLSWVPITSNTFFQELLKAAVFVFYFNNGGK